MIDISNKIKGEVGPNSVENYIIPQQEKTIFGKKADEALEISEGHNVKSVVYTKPAEDKEETFSDKLQQQCEKDAKCRKDQMVVLSNTLSPEDYGKIQEDGFSISESTGKTIVTETDQIKAALAKAGVDISIYGDDLSKEQLEEIAGSEAVAIQIKNSLEGADLPVTRENIEDEQKAFEQAMSIGKLSEDAIVYILKNELEPTISNLYKAQFSSKEMISSYQKQSIALTDEEFEGMSQQIEDIINKSARKVDKVSIEDCRWLINNGIAVTEENLDYLSQLKDLLVEETEVLQSMTQAILEGGRPEDGMLIRGYSALEKAHEAMTVVENATTVDIQYCVEQELEITISNLRIAENVRYKGPIVAEKVADKKHAEYVLVAERRLAEIQLTMTVKANYSLIKRGFAIDTKPLEQLVDALREQEQQFYKDMLEGADIEATPDNIRSLGDVTTAINQMKSYPAYAMRITSSETTIRVLHREGAVLKDTFEKANQRYDTMMTSPRADMGDSITKAFRNVDDILTDLGYNLTEENQRAVRILAYNNTELTPENIDRMKAVDEEVQRAFKNMTPAVTLEMIRKGIQPLDMTAAELNAVAEEIKAELGHEDTERFNKYLWKLEQNHQITEEERSSYIGIYRLIAQVEKSDGAALGAVINQGGDMTMRNLLTAIRSQKKGKMDYSVDDDFAGVEGKAEGPKIDSQIMAAYSLNCVKDVMDMITPDKAQIMAANDWESMTPEELKNLLEQADSQTQANSQMQATNNTENKDLDIEYAKQCLNEYQEAVTTSTEIYRIMEHYDIANTVGNIIATSGLIKNANTMFKTIFGDNRDERILKVRELKEQVLERFGQAVKTPSELAKAQEELAELATHAMDNMIMEEENPTTLDVRQMRLACNQFKIAAHRAKSESYVIPVETTDGVVTGMSLKIVRGEERKGLVDIFFQYDGMGKVAATFEAKEKEVSGVIAVSDPETKELLSSSLQLLVRNMNEDSEESLNVRILQVDDLSSEKFESISLNRSKSAENNTKNEAYQVQTKRLYNIAAGFINTIRDIAGNNDYYGF